MGRRTGTVAAGCPRWDGEDREAPLHPRRRAAVTRVDPASYHAWYQTPRGAWIGDTELGLLGDLLRPRPGETLLDVGCGAGYFAMGFAAQGLGVTGLDPDRQALAFLRGRSPMIPVVGGSAEALPFGDGVFDHAVAVTSLCFVARPARAIAELWRVSRRAVVLGLLHRRSLLYLAKRGRGGYQGARWDVLSDVRAWVEPLSPRPELQVRWAVFLPGAGSPGRLMESRIPRRLPLGGFLAVCLRRAKSGLHVPGEA